MIDDERIRVWGAMTDEELEARLFTYQWLALNTPNSHAIRLRQLAEEAERLGQAGHVGKGKTAGRNCQCCDN